MVLLPQAEQQIIQSYVCYVGEGRKEVAFFFPSQTEILLKDIFTVFFCVFVCWVFFVLFLNKWKGIFHNTFLKQFFFSSCSFYVIWEKNHTPPSPKPNQAKPQTTDTPPPTPTPPQTTLPHLMFGNPKGLIFIWWILSSCFSPLF